MMSLVNFINYFYVLLQNVFAGYSWIFRYLLKNGDRER